MFKITEKTIDLGNGRIITLQTGKMARQADGAVLVKMGNTMLLATVMAAKEAKEDTRFMPLSVEYKEKYASSGRFPGGFLKRESRPSDYEILISRLVDRVLRPLFPDDFHAETFVTISLISADKDIIPDALAGLAASAALAVSDIPFNGPISEVRVARVANEFIINPTAPGRHPVYLARRNRLYRAETVAMHHRALEQIGNGGEPDMGMGAHVNSRARRHLRRARNGRRTRTGQRFLSPPGAALG